jgi:cytochrome P450
MTLDEIDLTDLDPFEQGFPHEVFTFLRREAPVWWHPPTAHTPGGEGFWVVSSYEHVMDVVRDPKTFSSETGPGREGAGGTLIEDLPRGITGTYLHVTDDPHHARMRSLINRAFTPRAIAQLDEAMRVRTRQIVDRVADAGRCDFLIDVARELPLQVIAEMLGLPQEDRHRLFECMSTILDYRERDLGQESEDFATAGAEMYAYADALIAKRRARPGDDIFSLVVHATIEEDGVEHKLADPELHGFFNLLFAAGSETTRNAIAGGLLALMEHPDQLSRLRQDPAIMPTAVEEILRWTSPVFYNRRTATCDVVLAGQRIRAGQKTTHWYPSANRDAAQFDEPLRFDVCREPNPHLSFNYGTHYCLHHAR